MLEILRYWLRWLWPLYKCPGCKCRHNDHPGFCNECFYKCDTFRGWFSMDCYSRGVEVAVMATAFSLAGGVRQGVISLSTVLTVLGAVILFGGLLYIRHVWKEIQAEEQQEIEDWVESMTGGVLTARGGVLRMNEHDPEKCGCKYIGMNMWDCGHTDGLTVAEGEEQQPDTDFMRWYCNGGD